MRFLRYAFSLFVVLACTSPVSARTADWNIIVYMAADNDLAPYAESNLRAMAEVGSTSDVNIIVQIKRPSNSELSGTYRYRLEKGDPFGLKGSVKLGDLNTGDPQTLEAFVGWAVDVYPARHNAVILWSHGSGWRVGQLNTLRRHDTAPAFKSIVDDWGHDDQLFQAKVETAFLNINKKQIKVDLLGFDACLMSMMEVWSGLAQYADVGVASEDQEPSFGWDYSSIFGELMRNPRIDSRSLGRLIASSYAASIKNSDSTAIRELPFTLSAIDLTRFDLVQRRFDEFLTSLSTSDGQILLQARKTMKAFSHREVDNWPNGIDLRSLISTFSTLVSSQFQKDAALNLIEAISSVVLSNVYSDNEIPYAPTGLAIYFPETLSVWSRDPEGKAYSSKNKNYPSAFIVSNHWPMLLHSILSADQPDPNRLIKPIAVQTDSNPALRRAACEGGGIDEERATARSSLLFSPLVSTQIDFLDIDMTLLSLIDAYCSGSKVQPDTQQLNANYFDKWTKLAKRAGDQRSLFLYFAIRLVCENDDAPPSSMDFITKYLLNLSRRDPDGFAALRTLFAPKFIAEARRGLAGHLRPLLPTLGAVTLYFEVYRKIVEISNSDIAHNQDSQSSRADALNIARALSAESYVNFIFLDLKQNLNKRIIYSKDVQEPWRNTHLNISKAASICDELDKLGLLEKGSQPVFVSAAGSCSYWRALLGFLQNEPSAGAKYASDWEHNFADSYVATDALLRNWQMAWVRATSLAKLGKSSEALASFKRAYAFLIEAGPHLSVTRNQLANWAETFSRAKITADIGDPTESPYLFFSQWLDAATTVTSDEELLRIIERARLFSGGNSIVTAYFGGELRLLQSLKQSPEAASSDGTPLQQGVKNAQIQGVLEPPAVDSDLQNAPQAPSDAIARWKLVVRQLSSAVDSFDFSKIKSNTVVYFPNAWSGKELIFLKNNTGWSKAASEFSIFAATLRELSPDNDTQMKAAFNHYLLPIWDKIRSNSSSGILYFIPNYFSQTVPFAALTLGNDKNVIDFYAVGYHPSLVAVSGEPMTSLEHRNALLVHSPTPADPKLFPPSALYAGQVQATVLRKNLPSSVNLTELSGSEATVGNLSARINQVDIVDIVAHGFALASTPSASGLVLSSVDGKTEGILSIQMMMEWRRQLEFLMLAGCQTGVVRPEGAFLGDAPSLVSLGLARSLGVALWKLGDDSGGLLMEEFYLKTFNGATLPEALRSSQLTVRARYKSPTLWAGVAIYTALQ
jgi:hypothetical protein